MSELQRKREKFILYGVTKLQMVDSTTVSSTEIDRVLSPTKIITTTKRYINHKHSDNGFNFTVYVIIPIAVLLFLVFLFLLICLVRRKMRTRQLQRDFSPHYGYDHSEAEIFDGYTQFADGMGSLERLAQERTRAKMLSPDRSEKSLESVEVSTISSTDSKPAGTSSPKKFVNSLYI